MLPAPKSIAATTFPHGLRVLFCTHRILPKAPPHGQHMQHKRSSGQQEHAERRDDGDDPDGHAVQDARRSRAAGRRRGEQRGRRTEGRDPERRIVRGQAAGRQGCSCPRARAPCWDPSLQVGLSRMGTGTSNMMVSTSYSMLSMQEIKPAIERGT